MSTREITPAILERAAKTLAEAINGGIIPPRDVILQRIAELQRRLKERETP